MTKPNELVETIQRAIEESTPGDWRQFDCGPDRYAVLSNNSIMATVCQSASPEDAYLIANAPTWLRALLAEIKQLKAPIAGYPSPEEIKDMLMYYAPTPVQKIVNHYADVLLELAKVKEELSAKDKVLEEVATMNLLPDMEGTALHFIKIKARSILSQYKGDTPDT